MIKASGSTRMSVEISHQLETRGFCALARRLSRAVTTAATADRNTTDNAINPRLTHPNNKTGVKYRPITAPGAIAGRMICLVNRFM